MAKSCFFFLIYYIVVVGRARSIAHHRRRKDRRSDTQVPRVTLRRIPRDIKCPDPVLRMCV